VKGAPILQLDRLVPEGFETLAPLTLSLGPGELMLVETEDARSAGALADCCCGLAAPAAGMVRFEGRHWAALPGQVAEALQGRVGRVLSAGGWLPHLTVAENVLLPLLFHTPVAERLVLEQAAELACRFGLPGLPLGQPGTLPPADQLRAACVRAFLGAPLLLLLELGFEETLPAEMLPPLLDALGAARARGAGCLWFTGLPRLLRDPAIPAARRILLGRREAPPAGLAAMAAP